MKKDERKVARTKMRAVLNFEGKSVKLKDISISGFGFFSGEDLELNHLYRGTIYLGNSKVPVCFSIVAHNSDRGKYGAEFIFMNNNSRRRLQASVFTNRDSLV